MSSLYIGVYKAIYDYSAQAEEELTVQADDLLYLLEKSDVDDWWKVKKREVATGDEEVEEPSGLVPANYIEPAPVVKTASALYDYDKQTEEELSFKEGEKFNVYDLKDPDWLLVGDLLTQTQFGFVPSNYIELDLSSSAPPITPTPVSNGSTGVQQPLPISSFAPPPQHKQRVASSSPAYKNDQELPPLPHQQDEYETPIKPARPVQQEREEPEDMDDEAPPPMPSRPGQSRSQSQNHISNSISNATSVGSPSQYENEEQVEPEHKFDGEYFTWYINEVDGRRKRAITLSVGQGLVILKPTVSSSKLSMKSSSNIDQQWKVRDLINFSNEKKHLFLEFKNPQSSIELHTGTKDVAEAIMSILGDIKGAESERGLKEVLRASKPSNNASNKRIGRLLYDFEAQSGDELQCREGDEVYIINESKSKDWWMVENIDSGRQGVVPSSYIEIIGSSNLDKLTDQPSRKKSVNRSSSTKGRVVDAKESKHKHRSRDERDKIRERDRLQRDKSSSSKHDSKEHDKSMPNIHRVRTWIDSSGSFKVEAEFLGCIEGKIHLHKTNGVKIAVGATKLSLEDLEYVEKVTGTSLESYKKEVERLNLKRAKSSRGSSGVGVSKSATAAINDIAPEKPTRPSSKSKATTAITEPDYDWFEFFLSCGVDIGNCQRYSLNFSREQMDENVLQDISPSLLRTLGLREGDIIRVMKMLDNKCNRKSNAPSDVATSTSGGGLFTEAGGALKNNNNSALEVNRVDAKALPSPQKQLPDPLANLAGTSKFEDDAWAVKPAARSSEDLLKSQNTSEKPATPQYTGSLQDLVSIKPIEVGNSSNRTYQTSNATVEPSAPALQPVKTGTLIQPGQQFSVQKTGGNTSNGGIAGQQTGGLIPVQRTGNLVPVQQTGGLIPVQPTGFMPIPAQPTGFMPIQATGGLAPQFTYGIIPLQTGVTTFQQQKTGGTMPFTTFGQPTLQQTGTFVPVQTGNFSAMPTTSFGQPLSLQKTGPLVPVQKTGGNTTGGFMPTNTFGQIQQPVGGFVGNQATGGFVGGQLTGGFQQQQQQQQPFGQFQSQPTTSFGSFPQNTFNQVPPQNTFNQAPPQNSFNQFQPQATFNQPQNSFGQFQPQQSFGQMPQSTYQTPQASFGQQQFNSFQPQQQQQPNIGQMTNMFQNTSIGQPQQSFPTTSFGQQQFDGFNPQPLQSQPTGAGFGNAPLQSQPTGQRRANLQSATADNPFGF
ncbi:actin cytoskeleton-regulatory complex protein Sla1p [[Candida] railenensis]|uniref:Actin cytoskeleton-regulatory complex protein SLA1 n=1 Tax=[Candida] railenensis TaxID=45579 RepID=A0A9P0QM45_9ASCO|nr:actin cytoskeleton-regulatory complex protein Sla1p [[Candida] railenensis]